MKRQINVTLTAEKKLKSLFRYLDDNWSEKVRQNLVRILDHNLKLISENPEIFPESQKNPGLRRCVFTKHTSLYYRFSTTQITIITVFDSRQDPEKLKKDL
ncbi:MAG: type II toxin-antitoxin system RelE/ParE family toxin [Salegentibacter sp.]